MQVLFTAQENECGDKADEPKDVIAVRMGYKYVVYPREPNFILPHLRLGSFSAVDQKKPPMHI